MKKILFVCNHNSARSQMAEGWMNSLCGDKFKALSAGIEPGIVNPYAIRVMDEAGIDISEHKSESVENYLDKNFDYVVTVCDKAGEVCPFFPGGKKYIHKSFEDPSLFLDREEETLKLFRRIRDEIKEWIENEFCIKETESE